MKLIRFLFKTLLFLLLFGFLILLTGDFYWKERFRNYSTYNDKALIIAHRGASGQAPENTLAAVKLALDQKADMIEIDVFLTQDEQLVVLHDETVDRTTNGQGLIEAMTLAEVKKLDAGSWFSDKYRGEKIPTLAEVLQTVQGKAQLLIEIKKSGRGITQKVAAMVKAHQATPWCVIQSFDPQVAVRLHELKAPLERHQLVIGNFPLFLPYHYHKALGKGKITQYQKVQAINSMYLFTTKNLIDRIHRQKQRIFVWTVNHPKDMRKLLQMGVDGLITNFPDQARAVKNALRKIN